MIKLPLMIDGFVSHFDKFQRLPTCMIFAALSAQLLFATCFSLCGFSPAVLFVHMLVLWTSFVRNQTQPLNFFPPLFVSWMLFISLSFSRLYPPPSLCWMNDWSLFMISDHLACCYEKKLLFIVISKFDRHLQLCFLDHDDLWHWWWLMSDEWCRLAWVTDEKSSEKC